MMSGWANHIEPVKGTRQQHHNLLSSILQIFI